MDVLLKAHEREFLSVLKGVCDAKARTAELAAAQFDESNALLQGYLQSLLKAHELEGEGWSVSPDLNKFVAPPSPPKPDPASSSVQ